MPNFSHGASLPVLIPVPAGKAALVNPCHFINSINLTRFLVDFTMPTINDKPDEVLQSIEKHSEKIGELNFKTC